MGAFYPAPAPRLVLKQYDDCSAVALTTSTSSGDTVLDASLANKVAIVLFKGVANSVGAKYLDLKDSSGTYTILIISPDQNDTQSTNESVQLPVLLDSDGAIQYESDDFGGITATVMGYYV